MLYKDHVGGVCESLRRFANDENTDLILLRNHLEQIICDVIVEIDEKVKLGEEYERLYVKPNEEKMNLCEHGNYHCQTCEIKMLNYVIEELKQENEKLNNKLKHFMQDAENKQKIIYKL